MIINRFTFVINLIFICLSVAVKAQITPDLTDVDPNFYHIDTTQYESADITGNDPIYIFYSKDNGYSNIPTLRAVYKDSSNLNFSWYLYNERTHDFDSLLKVENGVKTSTRNECTQGGYKVAIQNQHNTLDTAFYCWVFQNEFNINNIIVRSSECDLMELQVYFNYDYRFNYFDRLTSKVLVFEVKAEEVKIIWTSKLLSIKDEPEIIFDSVVRPKFNAPTKPTKYRVTITDKFNKYKTKKIDINEEDNNGSGNLYLKATKARFSASRAFVPIDETDSTGQAPLTVQFIDSSENAYEYEWLFYRQADKRMTRDSLLRKPVITKVIPDSITYYQPGDSILSDGSINSKSKLDGYDVALIVKGPIYKIGDDELRCVDTLLRKKYIKVHPTFVTSDKKIPNVFTPGGQHPVFKLDTMPTSVRYFSVKIYNRWGNKIYEYEDNNGQWQGWDGETRGFGSAPTGVYFYVIMYDGWNGEKRSIRKGYVHLFRSR